MDEGIGGPFFFNVAPDLLERAADEADSIAIAFAMSGNTDAATLGGWFFAFAQLFRERLANPNPAFMDVSKRFVAPRVTSDVLRTIIGGLAGRQLSGHPAATNELWKQFAAAIEAQRRAENLGPDDAP